MNLVWQYSWPACVRTQQGIQIIPSRASSAQTSAKGFETEGRKEGRKQASKEGRKEARKEGRKQARKEGAKNVQEEEEKIARKSRLRFRVGLRSPVLNLE